MLAARIENFILTNEEVREANPIFQELKSHRWVIVKSYYSMYQAVLALLAKLGIKTESHLATTLAFELYFVRQKEVEEKYLKMLKKVAKISDKYLGIFKKTKRKRFVAQYDVTSSITKREAGNCLELAEEFIRRIEKAYKEFG